MTTSASRARRTLTILAAAAVAALSTVAANPAADSAPPQSGSSGTAAAALQPAAGFDKLFIHDECLSENTAQPDTCLHARTHERSFTFGGQPGTMYDVTLRIRGLFEPTTIGGGETPTQASPYFVVGGQTRTPDYSQWHIDVADPKQTYTLNHYPQTSHTIYKEDFQITIPIRGGANVLVQTIDSNDREIDNGAKGRPDRQQIIEGVTDTPPAGQVLRIDVVKVAGRH
jgi:hypothetical protein